MAKSTSKLFKETDDNKLAKALNGAVEEEVKQMSEEIASEEEKKEALNILFDNDADLFYIDDDGIIDGKPTDLMTEGLNSVLFGPKTVTLYMDWLLKHHFDFNNLIKPLTSSGLTTHKPLPSNLYVV